MNQLKLSFFGAFQATLGNQPLTHFRSAKVQGLLIYLAFTPQQPQARDVLAALFWPDEPESVAKQNLRQSLYRLRKVLRDTDSRQTPTLLVNRSTVQFNPDSDYLLDVADFLSQVENKQLETAVDMYRGELLPGFRCDSLPFDEWLRSERERLHRLALDALFELTAHSLARADYQKAQNLARQQLALEPWREEAHRQLMQSLAMLGERSAALAQYETCRVVLAEELGIEPSAETETLAAHIRKQQPEPPTRHKPGNTQARRQLSIPFVGRNDEYSALVEAYRRAARDGLQVVTVMGNAGIGKTHLTEHFLRWAALQGANVLNGRAYETSAGLSYQPLTHLLRQRLERENAPEDLLSDLWLTQLTRLLPELRDRYPDLPEPTQEEATARQHLFEAITRLGLALANRAPLILFIDDWHWADTASLDVLHYAALRWAEEKVPILLLLTLRQETVNESPDLQSWLTRLKNDIALVQVNLGGLSQAETEQLIRELFALEAGSNDSPPPNDRTPSSLTQFSQWLFAETDGQPLFLTETLKALVEDGLVQPDTSSAAWQIKWSKLAERRTESQVLPRVQEIIRGWLVRITAPANELLTAVSVLGQAASFDHLCRVTTLEEMEVIAALDELIGKQLLLETNEARPADGLDPLYSFAHQKVSEVVYAEAGTARRRLLHRRAFEALQASAAQAAACAYHALNAGLLAETIQYSLVAGNQAMALFAVQVAITHFETAWQVTEKKGWPETVSGADRQALYIGLGRAYEHSADWAQAQEIYQAMLDYAQAIVAPAMECLGLNRLATTYIMGMSDQPQALALLEQARTVAEQNGDQQGLAETEWNLAVAAIYGQKDNLARDHGEQALATARALGHPQLLARCLNSLAIVYTHLRQWHTVEAYAIEARQLYAAAGNQVLAADSQRMAGLSQMFSGRPQESLATLQDTLAFSQQIENVWGEADCAWKLARAQLELGHYGQAITFARQAIKQTRLIGIPGVGILALAAWGTVQRTVMALGPGKETLKALLLELGDQDLIGYVTGWILAELCALHALAGEWEQAGSYVKQALAFPREEPLLPVGLTGWYETEALLRGGEGELARAEVKQMGELVGNNKRYRLILLRSQAVLAQWDGDVVQAIAYLQAALTLAQEIGLPGEAWPILSALGGLYAERGEEVQARGAYEEAGTIIHRLAESIDDEGLRVGFVTAVPVRAVLEKSELTR